MAETSNLRIPSALSSALSEFAASSDVEFSLLLDALMDFGGAGPDELFEHLRDRLGRPEGETAWLVRLLLSFESLRQAEGWTPQEGGAAIADAEGAPGESGEDRAELAARVAQVLEHGGLGFATRVGDALSANASIWRSARFLTDARAIFDDDALSGSVIITRLEVTYVGSDGRQETVYFALDDDDLDDLTQAVDVARKQVAEVRKKLRGAGVRVATTSIRKGMHERA